MNLLTIRGLHLRLSRLFTLQNISFDLKSGETIGIIGPNGAGKSTLIKAVSGKISGKGTILLKDRPVADYSRKEMARLLGVVPQDSLPLLSFTVREVVEMGRFVHRDFWGKDTKATKEKGHMVDEVLDSLNLSALSHRQLDTLSGGENQRVILAKALVQEPEILIMDEPTAHLDPAHKVLFMKEVKRWQKAGAKAVLTVMHDLNLAACYCDKLLLLAGGQVLCMGVPEKTLTVENIHLAYGIKPAIVRHPVNQRVQILF